jgi:hypothetical protein
MDNPEYTYWADLTYTYKIYSNQPLTAEEMEERVLELWGGGETTDTDGNTVHIKLKTTEFDCHKD